MKDVIVFLDASPERAGLAYQRMNDEDKRSTFWCTTAAEAIGVLRDYQARIYRVYLEHDLGGSEGSPVLSASEESGMEVVRFLEKQDSLDYKDCEFVVHTHNQYAAKKMIERLIEAGYTTLYSPFGL